MKKQFAQYKYRVPSCYKYRNSHLFLKLLLTYIFVEIACRLVQFLDPEPFHTVLAALLTIIISCIALGIVGPSKNKILIANSFIVIGEKIIFYGAISRIVIKTTSNICMISVQDDIYELRGDRFPTDAQKKWKITANQKKKFDKMVKKLATAARNEFSKTQIIYEKV